MSEDVINDVGPFLFGAIISSLIGVVFNSKIGFFMAAFFLGGMLMKMGKFLQSLDNTEDKQ